MKTKQKTWESMSAEERDALVAENVMGYSEPFECSKSSNGPWRVAFKHHPDDNLGDYRRHYLKTGGKVYCGEPHAVHYPPQFTTSISAAFEVVEKMRSEGYYVTLTGNPYWIVRIETPDNGSFEEVDVSLPDTICLAALRAKGIEV